MVMGLTSWNVLEVTLCCNFLKLVSFNFIYFRVVSEQLVLFWGRLEDSTNGDFLSLNYNGTEHGFHHP